MRLRLTAALLATLTLALLAVAAAPPAAPATPLTIPQLRAKLRHARHHLAVARETLRAARGDLAGVRALVAALEAAAVAAGPAPPGVEQPGEVPADAGPVSPEVEATASSAPAPSPEPAPMPEPPATVPLGDVGVQAALALVRPGLAARLLADGVVSADELAALEARVARWRSLARRARRAEHALEARLDRRLQIREWNREGAWRPLIEIAAQRYDVSAQGLYRLMMSESGGRRRAGSTYKGLFQYHPGTWTADWNPWRSASIYDGWAQIRATAYAISRGMGPGHWPNTYPRAF